MAFVSSVFKNLTLSYGNATADFAIGSAFSVFNFKKNGDRLVFYTPKGYDNVFAYAAKRTLMQTTFANLNDLYPKYLRHHYNERAKKQYNKSKEGISKIIENGEKTDEEFNNKHKVTLKYQGKTANEGLLMWIKKEGEPVTVPIQTYWDKIKGLSSEAASKSQVMANTEIKVAGDCVMLDLGATVQVQSANNLILTKVQGRNASRKELISGGDLNFTVTGKIVSNYPDIYPYHEVSKLITLLQHQGAIQVYNIMFQQFNVTQILIKDFQMGQNRGFKNEQPYSFTCVAIEADENVKVVDDTIGDINYKIEKQKDKKWTKMLLDKVKEAAVNQTTQAIEALTSKYI